MRKILIALTTVIVLGCGKDNRTENSDSMNTEDNVEENSGKNISPQLQDSAGRLEVDTVSSASEVEKQKGDK